MTASMSGKGECWVNTRTASFFEALKLERVDHVRCPTRAGDRLDIVDRIEGFHHRERWHSSIGYRTPVAEVHRPMAA